MRACAPMEHIAQCLGEVRCREGVRCALSRRHREYSDWFCFFLLKGFLPYTRASAHDTCRHLCVGAARRLCVLVCCVPRASVCRTYFCSSTYLSIYLSHVLQCWSLTTGTLAAPFTQSSKTFPPLLVFAMLCVPRPYPPPSQLPRPNPDVAPNPNVAPLPRCVGFSPSSASSPCTKCVPQVERGVGR